VRPVHLGPSLYRPVFRRPDADFNLARSYTAQSLPTCPESSLVLRANDMEIQATKLLTGEDKVSKGDFLIKNTDWLWRY
jgi:hypothetical protein